MRCKHCGRTSSFLIDCKCGNSYCTKHQLPELHSCAAMSTFQKDAQEKNEKLLLKGAQKEKPEWIT